MNKRCWPRMSFSMVPCAAAGPLAKPAVMWFQWIPTAISGTSDSRRTSPALSRLRHTAAAAPAPASAGWIRWPLFTLGVLDRQRA